jgi:hypothetical protein
LIKNINNKIYIIEGYISKSTSDFLTETFNSTTSDAPDYQIKGGPSLSPENGYTFKCGNPIKSYQDDNNYNIGIDILTMLCNSMSNTISDFLDTKMDIKTMFYGLMLEGSEMKMHTDNYITPNDPESIRKNSKDDWSGLLYLNDNYEGGLLEFPQENFSIRPEAGTFIFFKGDHDLPHKVSKIEKGHRNVIISFFWPTKYRGLDTVLG